ncbi:MAG: CHAT domain-containing protein, partial [Anaerolineae bacterium]|nr:CHAT domain-containing protein [Anaerolineae bacterium]
AMNNLAIAYVDRIRGDRADNIERAIAAYQQALTVRTQSAMPAEWAETMMNLATAFADRIRGDRADNIEQAIAVYQQALTVMTQSDVPVKWAQTMNNLANAYRNRIRGDRADNIEQAIAACQQALTVMKQSTMRVEWAETMMNLAAAFAERIRGDRADNIEQAIAAYQQTLIVMTRSDMPVRWATIMNNLGVVHYSRIRGDEAENVEQAIYYYQQALEVWTREAFPMEHRDGFRNLVLLFFGEKRWAEAYWTCLDAIAVGLDIFAAAYSDAGRINAIKQTGQLYTRAAYSALQLEQYSDALVQLEMGKAQLLAEAQSLSDANLVLLDNDERACLQGLREQIKVLEYEARLPQDNPARRDDRAISNDLRDARAKMRSLINELRAKYPDFMPEGLGLADLLANIPADGALVAPLFTTQGSAVFIVPGDVSEVTAEHVLMLDDFTLDDLSAITRSYNGEPGWLRYYMDYRFNGADASRLFYGIDDVTHRLWRAFVGQIHERLETLGVQRVLLMPQGDSNLVPLHAAWREVGGMRCYFMNDYIITYTPSMAALAAAKRKPMQGEGALVVGVSKYETMNDLPNTRAEAESIASLFGTEALLDGDASVGTVRERVPGKAFVHLSCHGGFGWGGDAFASALYLGNDESLPLPQIIAHLDTDAARLVVLSACETGIVDFHNIPDEFVGLPAGFMQAGAQAVVSSLWAVEDRSTALLMERMYKDIRDESNPMEPAQALRAAQFWLRDATVREIGDYYESYLRPRMSELEAADAFIEIMKRAAPDEKPYSHPFYWAAFTYNGV